MGKWIRAGMVLLLVMQQFTVHSMDLQKLMEKHEQEDLLVMELENIVQEEEVPSKVETLPVDNEMKEIVLDTASSVQGKSPKSINDPYEDCVENEEQDDVFQQERSARASEEKGYLRKSFFELMRKLLG